MSATNYTINVVGDPNPDHLADLIRSRIGGGGFADVNLKVNSTGFGPSTATGTREDLKAPGIFDRSAEQEKLRKIQEGYEADVAKQKEEQKRAEFDEQRQREAKERAALEGKKQRIDDRIRAMEAKVQKEAVREATIDDVLSSLQEALQHDLETEDRAELKDFIALMSQTNSVLAENARLLTELAAEAYFEDAGTEAQAN